jgi:rRNA maturation protein Rpf1
MYTTSRYASKDTRALAGAMARDCGERYVARGKKTIAGLAIDARRLGEATISILEERKGAAGRISVIAVDELGRWRFQEERLLNIAEK